VVPGEDFDVACMLCVLALIMIVWILMVPCSPLCVGVINLSICASAAASINANALHAARQLLHRGVNLLNIAVTIFLSGLRAKKALRDVAVARNAVCRANVSGSTSSHCFPSCHDKSYQYYHS
jgi:hypothetical protein